MAIQAFISCRFPPDDSVKRICTMLQPEIVPYISRDVKLGSLPIRLKEKISKADCLIAILTKEGSSAFVQNEVGIAFALNKPVFAIYEGSVDVQGIQPYLSTFIKFDGKNEASIAEDILSLKTEISERVASTELTGSPQEILDQLHENGVMGIYPDRATAFRAFLTIWDREPEISIVGSTIEGFKRGIGIDVRQFLISKLKESDGSKIKILLTHPSVATYRGKQEQELDGHVINQIRSTDELLKKVSQITKAGERLQWKFFNGTPTCFMIMAGSFMLLNPYLYMQPAYFNFSMIVKDTKSVFDIYNHYKENHFRKAWESDSLVTKTINGNDQVSSNK